LIAFVQLIKHRLGMIITYNNCLHKSSNREDSYRGRSLQNVSFNQGVLFSPGMIDYQAF